LRHVTLPGIRPVLLFVVLTQLIASFQVFGQMYLVTGGGPQRSTRVMVQYLFETAFGNYRMGYGATLSWLLFLVTGLLSLVVVRLMRERER
jgi:multiple sugar transport system permease protein